MDLKVVDLWSAIQTRPDWRTSCFTWVPKRLLFWLFVYLQSGFIFHSLTILHWFGQLSKICHWTYFDRVLQMFAWGKYLTQKSHTNQLIPFSVHLVSSMCANGIVFLCSEFFQFVRHNWWCASSTSFWLCFILDYLCSEFLVLFLLSLQCHLDWMVCSYLNT
jgi:hypothetical protein